MVGINRMVRLLKQVVSEAAGEKTPEAYPLGYVEDFSRRERSGAFLQRARSPLKMISSKAAGILNAEAYLMGHSPLVQIGAT